MLLGSKCHFEIIWKTVRWIWISQLCYWPFRSHWLERLVFVCPVGTFGDCTASWHIWWLYGQLTHLVSVWPVGTFDDCMTSWHVWWLEYLWELGEEKTILFSRRAKLPGWILVFHQIWLSTENHVWFSIKAPGGGRSIQVSLHITLTKPLPVTVVILKSSLLPKVSNIIVANHSLTQWGVTCNNYPFLILKLSIVVCLYKDKTFIRWQGR